MELEFRFMPEYIATAAATAWSGVSVPAAPNHPKFTGHPQPQFLPLPGKPLVVGVPSHRAGNSGAVHTPVTMYRGAPRHAASDGICTCIFFWKKPRARRQETTLAARPFSS